MSLVFPELVLIKNISKNKNQYKIDWSPVTDKAMTKNRGWVENQVNKTKYSDGLGNQKMIDYYLNIIYPSIDWTNYFYPEKYQHMYDLYDEMIIDDHYLKEIEHFIDLAISEWSRPRSFDTSIREGCLSVGQEAVDRVFYLLKDCSLVNKDVNGKYLYDTDIRDYIKSLWLFRFWRNQTGGGIVVSKATENFNYGIRTFKNGHTHTCKVTQKEGVDYINELELCMNYTPEEYNLHSSSNWNNGFKDLKKLIIQRMRVGKIEKFLEQ